MNSRSGIVIVGVRDIDMRIAHVVSTFPPYHGGMGNVAREIAERTAKRGHEIVVVTPGRRIMNNESRIMDRGRSHDSLFRIHYSVPALRTGNAAWCPGILRELERMQPDIVHLHWPFIGGIAPVLAWRRRVGRTEKSLSQFRAKPRKGSRRRCLVVHYHMDLIAEGWKGVLFRWYERWTLPRVLRLADRVVVSSRDYGDHSALAPFAAKLGDRLTEIPFGVDTIRFFPSHREGELEGVGNNEAMKQWNNALSVLFVGGLDRAHAFKGVPVLLDAIARIPSVTLRIVGDGDLRSSYEQQARALGIADRVAFLGAVSDEQLPAVYQLADVLVLPSTARSEAFGIVLLEAMASGIPVIASDFPGVRTVIAEGETGFLVPPDDVVTLAERLADLA
ncbi:MAG: glycosyltransferase family 4 protein, partial [bacterium]|nr:glycosyltransferase family 4 protein [bacterium]